jgi:heat shock protein HslJ
VTKGRVTGGYRRVIVIALFAVVIVVVVIAYAWQSSASPEELQRHTWRLTAFQTVEGPRLALRPDETYKVRFDDANGIDGQADCNRFCGSYTAAETGHFGTFVRLQSHANCGAASREFAFYEALARAKEFRIRGRRLTIVFDDREGGRLVFRRTDGEPEGPDMPPLCKPFVPGEYEPDFR